MNPGPTGGLAGNAFTWPQAAEGSQYRDIGNTAGTALSQDFVVAHAGDVTLSWKDNTALAILPGFQTAPYRVTVQNSGATAVYTADLDSWHASGAWQARTATLTLPAGTYTLVFASQNLSNRTDTLIDAASVLGPSP
jgi:hypothetical protein